MKYNDESYKQWVVRILQQIAADYIDNSVKEKYFGPEISALEYTIGYLIGIGWADE